MEEEGREGKEKGWRRGGILLCIGLIICVCSGPDRVIMKIEGANNEVEQFLNSWYISASESARKLSMLPITDRYHAVVKLANHFPDQHSLFMTRIWRRKLW